jgi:hypothetical protein
MSFNITYFPSSKSYKEASLDSKSTLKLTTREMKMLFPEAEIQVENLFGIPNSYTAVYL